MKIDSNFDSTKDLTQKRQLARQQRRHDFWLRLWPIVGWCAYFFVAFLASQCLVALGLLALSHMYGFNVKHLSDLADAVIEAILYVVLIFLFALLPLKFLPKIKRHFAVKSSNPKLSLGKHFLTDVGLARWPKISDLGWAIYMLPLFYFALFVAMMVASVLFGSATMRQTQTLAFTQTAKSWELWAIGLSLCVMAPVAEEILLRGFLYTKIRRHFGYANVKNNGGQFADSRVGDIVTALAVSLVFALAHGQLNVGLMTFILSMFNSHLRHQSGAIYSGILVHMAVNFLAFSIRYLGFLHGIANL